MLIRAQRYRTSPHLPKRVGRPFNYARPGLTTEALAHIIRPPICQISRRRSGLRGDVKNIYIPGAAPGCLPADVMVVISCCVQFLLASA